MPDRSPDNAQVSARVRISDVTPQLDCGRYGVKRVVGEAVEVGATVIADGDNIIIFYQGRVVRMALPDPSVSTEGEINPHDGE